MVKAVKIVGHMVTRNEEARYLSRCLWSLMKIVDELVVFDDLSTDKTPEICAAAGATVVVRPAWCPAFSKSEWQFRSTAWKQLDGVAVPGEDWILCVDADEFFVPTVPADTRELLLAAAAVDVDGWSFKVREVFNVRADGVPQIRTDGWWGTITATRFCRYTGDAAFPDGPWCGSVPESVLRVRPSTDVEILHYGYATVADRQAKYARYRTDMRGHNEQHVASILMHPTLKAYQGALL